MEPEFWIPDRPARIDGRTKRVAGPRRCGAGHSERVHRHRLRRVPFQAHRPHPHAGRARARLRPRVLLDRETALYPASSRGSRMAERSYAQAVRPLRAVARRRAGAARRRIRPGIFSAARHRARRLVRARARTVVAGRGPQPQSRARGDAGVLERGHRGTTRPLRCRAHERSDGTRTGSARDAAPRPRAAGSGRAGCADGAERLQPVSGRAARRVRLRAVVGRAAAPRQLLRRAVDSASARGALRGRVGRDDVSDRPVPADGRQLRGQ